MNTLKRLLHSIPEPVVILLRPVAKALRFKYFYELAYWRIGFRTYGDVLENARYEPIMLAMAGEGDQAFLAGKVVADFGCGPRGSLSWATSALLRIGIDVLADRYADAFKDVLVSQNMVYLKSTERTIPLPSGFVDVMYTLNAVDHVDNFELMCGEILRVMKPGALFVGSFNLCEPATLWEPQTLTIERIRSGLLMHLDVESQRASRQGPDGHEYAPFFEGTLDYREGDRGFLWIRGRKKSSTALAS